jgi:UPF0716 protein FxsA
MDPARDPRRHLPHGSPGEPGRGGRRPPLPRGLLVLALFLALPILELYVLIRVGTWIGAWTTIGLVLLTAVIGVVLLRWQGLSTFARGIRRLEAGEIPAGEIIEGMLLGLAGGLLLTPGFITDVVGFVVLVPAARVRLSRYLLDRLQMRPLGWPGGAGGPHDRGTIEGEFERRDDRHGP